MGFYLDTLAALKGKPENVRNLTVTSISNVICSIIVGERFDFSDKLFVDFVNNFTRQVGFRVSGGKGWGEEEGIKGKKRE